MDNHKEKSKNTNIFLNNQSKQKDNQPINKLNQNRFANEIGKHIEPIQKREININNIELFPSLIDDLTLLSISKANKKNTKTEITYANVAKNVIEVEKNITYDVDPGWSHLFRGDNGQIKRLDGPMTDEWFRMETKIIDERKKKQEMEFARYFKEMEEDRLLRIELFGDFQDFYDPRKDPFYTKEEDIIIYTGNDQSDTDSEGSNYDQDQGDYLNDDNYL